MNKIIIYNAVCLEIKSNTKRLFVGLYYGAERQYFSFIVAVSFIGGGNRSARRKLPTYRKLLTNFIT
jgi:hypothetical protein